MDEIIIIDSFSTDKTLEYIKELDVNKKITVIQKKWENDYAKQRNFYLEYIKKNIFPKHRNDLYYLRVDADEVYLDGWLEKAKEVIEENPDYTGLRGNFYSLTQDYNHLDTKQPTESRVSLFKYAPDLIYTKTLHEWPIHSFSKLPFYGNPRDDKGMGIHYMPGYQYLHYSWCDPVRCFQKAKNYTKIYVEQGTETKEHLANMTPTKDSWWWDKKSDIKYKGKLPAVFTKFGLLEGQENPEEQDSATKISVYTIVKNAVKFDYPIIEAIRSILPIADEVVVNLGDSDDGTQGLLHKAFDGTDKVKFFNSVWEGRDKGTLFLRNQSNITKDRCKNEICLYLQADEVYNEEDYDEILATAKLLSERQDLVGVTFKWLHFDGIPTYVNKNSYPVEVRLIKKNALESIGDAQSMGLIDAGLLNVMALPTRLWNSKARVYHYGWLRKPEKMLAKLQSFDGFYHNDQEMILMHGKDNEKFPDGRYDYGKKIPNFFENHPYVMYNRIRRYERNS